MMINLLYLLDGAKKAEGLTVVIDVLRAFSLEAYLFDKGITDLMPVGDLEESERCKAMYPDSVSFGERHGIQLPGFDYGNSPFFAKDADLNGRKVIHTTSAGTQGIVNAVNADEILTASFVNAAAVARYISNKWPNIVSIVCMGLEGKTRSVEDDLCGEYIKSLLMGAPMDQNKIIDNILKSPIADRFRDQNNRNSLPEEDLMMCLDFNRFDYVLKVERRADGFNHVRRIVT